MCLDSFRQNIGEILLTFFDYFVSVKLCKQTFTNDSFMIFSQSFVLRHNVACKHPGRLPVGFLVMLILLTFTVFYQNGKIVSTQH